MFLAVIIFVVLKELFYCTQPLSKFVFSKIYFTVVWKKKRNRFFWQDGLFSTEECNGFSITAKMTENFNEFSIFTNIRIRAETEVQENCIN